MKAEVIDLKRHEDSRGSLLKVLMRHQVGTQREFGEIYVCTSRPGEIRAHHYHEDTTEWFCVIGGEGRIRLQNIDSQETVSLDLRADTPQVVIVPPRIAHVVENTGATDLVLLAYADAPYDSTAPDTEPYEVSAP